MEGAMLGKGESATLSESIAYSLPESTVHIQLHVPSLAGPSFL